MSKELTLKDLQDAMSGSTAAFRCRTKLQPAGGEGDKVFPPTYAGAVYATETRRLPGRDEPVECVLLDSVQAQANRMEEALQQAVDDGRLRIPVIEVDFTDNGLLTEVGKVTSLQAPHRIADAILRDSLLGDKPFRLSDDGKQIDSVSLANATPLYELCPTALVFGMWDSTGPKGGLGAKFQRAIVSEIVGVDAEYGVKTSSRIDPLGIQRNTGPLYRRPDGGWTIDPAEALFEIKKEEPTGRVVLYKRNKQKQDVYHEPGLYRKDDGSWTWNWREAQEERDDHDNPTGRRLLFHKQKSKDVFVEPMSTPFADQGRPSEANHSNFPPSIDESAGGVTVASAEQMVVLSLPALRRLQFPLNGGKPDPKVNDAGRTVLAALGLCAAVLAAERGLDLRSRCLLWPTEAMTWELLGKPGSEPEPVTLDSDTAIALLNSAVEAAESVGLNWRKQPLELKPSLQLVQLVRKSQELAAAQGVEEEGTN